MRWRSSRSLVAVSALFLLLIMYTSQSDASNSANSKSVAVVIGNSDYQRTVDVLYAADDSKRIKKFLVEVLGYQESNIIYTENATVGRILDIFGDERNPNGELWSKITPNESNVFIYYSGHGVPILDTETGNYTPHLLPVDIAPSDGHRGSSIDAIERSLERVGRDIGDGRTITLVIDACFSGASPGGPLLESKMAISAPNLRPAKAGMVRFSASQGDQLAYWDSKQKGGIFTNAFLIGSMGEADKAPFGNGDGLVSGIELAGFVQANVSLTARRSLRAEQIPDSSGNLEEFLVYYASLPKNISEGFFKKYHAEPLKEPRNKNPAGAMEQEWLKISNTKNLRALQSFLKRYPDNPYQQQIVARIKSIKSAEPKVTKNSAKPKVTRNSNSDSNKNIKSVTEVKNSPTSPPPPLSNVNPPPVFREEPSPACRFRPGCYKGLSGRL